MAYAYETQKAYRTQKANSVYALNKYGFSTPSFFIYPIERFYKAGNLFTIGHSELVGKFVRPCPVTPRHGFVDSRPVHTIEEAEKLIRETYDADPNAELIAMPFIDTAYSAIWTEGLLVVGPKNDGATAGNASRSIPILGYPTKKDYNWAAVKDAAGVTQSPYMEMLWSKSDYYSGLSKGGFDINCFQTLYVQLRNGPKVPQTVDFIPSKVKVKEVFIARAVKKADGQSVVVDRNGQEIDLVGWETKAKTFKAGTVVYHPGGSLASHVAVHCCINNVPVLISREPKVGETLENTATVAKPNLEKIRQGFVMGAKAKINFQTAAFMMLVGCHSTSLWMGLRDELLGFAMGCCYRLTVTASLGEARHSPKRKRKANRETVYERVWNKVLNSAVRTRFAKAIDDFRNLKWRSGFGGEAWANFASFAGEMYNSLIDSDVPRALEFLNKCVNAAHNTGWGFDKFITRDYMDRAAQNTVLVAIPVVPLMYDIIVKAETNSYDTDFFSGKHHFDTNLDEKAAAQDEEEEEKDGDYNDTADDDCDDDEDECDCADCLKEKKAAEEAAKLAGTCEAPEGCEDKLCDKCYKYTFPIAKAQGYVQITPNGYMMKIQYKHGLDSIGEYGKGYYTFSVPLTAEQGSKLMDYQKGYFSTNLISYKSFAKDSGKMYVPMWNMKENGVIYWIFGYNPECYRITAKTMKELTANSPKTGYMQQLTGLTEEAAQ